MLPNPGNRIVLSDQKDEFGIPLAWVFVPTMKNATAQIHELLRSMTRAQATELLSAFGCPSSENGLHWDGDTLFDRLDDPTRDSRRYPHR
jgi:hypothetical protein